VCIDRMLNTERILTNNGYGCTQLFQHASSCSLRNMKNDAPEPSVADSDTESWLSEKQASVHVTLSDGSVVEFFFSNVLFEGRRCQKCSFVGCSNKIVGVTGLFHAKQHVMKYHDRKTSIEIKTPAIKYSWNKRSGYHVEFFRQGKSQRT